MDGSRKILTACFPRRSVQPLFVSRQWQHLTGEHLHIEKFRCQKANNPEKPSHVDDTTLDGHLMCNQVQRIQCRCLEAPTNPELNDQPTWQRIRLVNLQNIQEYAVDFVDRDQCSNQKLWPHIRLCGAAGAGRLVDRIH